MEVPLEILAGLGLALAVLLICALCVGGAKEHGAFGPKLRADGRIPIGIVGDSDSTSYQGRIRFTAGDPGPGGAYHSSTLQWPEVLARIRGSQVDLGTWGIWGLPRGLSLARIRDRLGLRWRGPRKEDYRHNFAWPSRTADLMNGAWRQVPRLVELMNENPQRWRQGIVVMRIGVNDFGKESLDALAIDPDDAEVRLTMDRCVSEIERAVGWIRRFHPSTGIVLVGIFDNAQDPNYHTQFRASVELSNIAQGLDRYDDGLRALAASHKNIAFFDDRAWFANHWGTRDPDGRPAYRTVSIGHGLEVFNRVGDSPDNTVLANGHAGLVWNVLWVQALVRLLHSALAVSVELVSDEEVSDFVASVTGTGTYFDSRQMRHDTRLT